MENISLILTFQKLTIWKTEIIGIKTGFAKLKKYMYEGKLTQMNEEAREKR